MSSLDELRILENGLWSFEIRCDIEVMDRMFAPDLFEFGRSGKRYARDELLLLGEENRKFSARLHSLSVKSLSPSIALVTYVSELEADGNYEWSNRSSIWDNSSGSWQLRFHQGTAIPPDLVPLLMA